MAQNSIPSVNPADAMNGFAGAMKLVLSKALKGTNVMLPARVIAYDRSLNRARVELLVSMVTTSNEIVQRGQIASVPVLQIGSGGFVLSFPIATGNLGWLIACDRDISLFKKTLQSSPPNTNRYHDFADGLFIPDTMLDGVTIAVEDVNNAVFQNAAGTVKISLWSNLLKIIAPRVGIGGTPDANAILDVQSTTKAFMPPRMTAAQRDAIPSPTEGMIIWNLDTHGLSSYNGSVWS